ncbi:PEP-CTERM sorting domain-containing protein [Aquincola sp. J276]|uniref:PEP-CTERM sorting domain-containing protein n=1 Tax=Aquincola sp. J276 TaxID=2898432 RepID=UPI00215080FB|nr:PEP-CTERM sorting domain-containing protein [Aquincola sp. J276]MCR5864077.1 hypothetical protein [Aquincola sp. J276]
MRTRRSSLMCLVGLCIVPALSGAFTLSETQWEVRSVETRDWPPEGSSSSFQRLANAGQPGGALLYNAVLRAPGQAVVTSSAIAITKDLVYSPAHDGRIGTLDYSQSLNVDASDIGLVSATSAFLVSQVVDGLQAVYAHAVPVNPVFGQWQTVTASGLVAADFVRVNLSTGQLLHGEHPTFDATLPTTFGIGVGAVLDNQGTGFSRARVQVRIDNLLVSVTPVPEPSSVWMCLAGLALLLAKLAHKHRVSHT